jgi:S1-C subfamily serine protease
MDTPTPSNPVPDDPASRPIPPVGDQGPSAATPAPTGPEPTDPIALGPLPGSWSPPPPLAPPTPPTAGAGGGEWGPYATPHGLAWGPYPIPPAPGVTRRHPHLVPLLGVAVVISILLGVGLGYAVWRPAGTTNNVAANTGGSSSQNPSSTFPFGEGSGTTPASGGSSASNGNATAIAAKVDPGLVDVNVTLNYQGESAAGTGQVLTSSGLVLTNNHVIDEATTISAVDLGNGRTYTASVVGYDRTGDLAVIQLHGASGLGTVSIGNSSKVAVGESIVAIGNAGGAGGTPSVAAGQVTTLNQAITASDDNGGNSEQLTGLIEVNANIEPGDSGGPLVDSAGQVVGIDTAASSSSTFSSASGDGYAIPINTAMTIAKEIEAGKSSSTVHVGATAFLGVEVVSGVCQNSFGLGDGGSSTAGATVCAVESGSPAEQVGLVVGDTITSIGGQTVTAPSGLSSVIASHAPGDSIPLVWVDASGTQHTATVELASGPPT